jgi:hypothetical protein
MVLLAYVFKPTGNWQTLVVLLLASPAFEAVRFCAPPDCRVAEGPAATPVRHLPEHRVLVIPTLLIPHRQTRNC